VAFSRGSPPALARQIIEATAKKLKKQKVKELPAYLTVSRTGIEVGAQTHLRAPSPAHLASPAGLAGRLTTAWKRWPLNP
jgi:hypothetical protein